MAGEATTARRFIEEILGTGDWSSAGEVLQPDVVMYHPSAPEPVRGLEAVQGFLGMFPAGMPDLSLTVEDLAGTSVCAARPRAVRIGGNSGEEPGDEQRGDAVGEQEDERAHTRDGERRRQHVRPPTSSESRAKRSSAVSRPSAGWKRRAS